MIKTKTNKLGKGITITGIVIFIGSFLICFSEEINFFGKEHLIGIGISVIFIPLGFYIRPVGVFLKWVGGIIFSLSIVQLLLVEIIGLKFFAFGLDTKYNIVEMDIIAALGGVVLLIGGYFFSRTEEEEERASIRAAERRKSMERNVSHQKAVANKSASSTRRCEICGKEAGGFLNWNSTLECRGCGTIVCTSCLKSTGWGQGACPKCGNEDLKYI